MSSSGRGDQPSTSSRLYDANIDPRSPRSPATSATPTAPRLRGPRPRSSSCATRRSFRPATVIGFQNGSTSGVALSAPCPSRACGQESRLRGHAVPQPRRFSRETRQESRPTRYAAPRDPGSRPPWQRVGLHYPIVGERHEGVQVAPVECVEQFQPSSPRSPATSATPTAPRLRGPPRSQRNDRTRIPLPPVKSRTLVERHLGLDPALVATRIQATDGEGSSSESRNSDTSNVQLVNTSAMSRTNSWTPSTPRYTSLPIPDSAEYHSTSGSSSSSNASISGRLKASTARRKPPRSLAASATPTAPRPRGLSADRSTSAVPLRDAP